MNLPNKLTLSRVAFIPFILIFMVPFPFLTPGFLDFVNGLGGQITALLLFVLAALTDIYDGRLARQRNIVSNFGKFLDPIADKMLVLSVYLAFVQLGRLSSWAVLVILAREFAVTGARLMASGDGVVIAASQLGKLKTAAQMTSLIFLLSEPILNSFLDAPRLLTTIGDVLVGVAIVFTIWSGIDYLWRCRLYFLSDMS